MVNLRSDHITLRILTPADAVAYRTLRLAALKAFPHAFRSAYEEAAVQPLSWAEQRLDTAGDTMFGAFANSVLVGAICLRTQSGAKIGHAAELKALIVDPQQQARGIGRALVSHLIDAARARGLRQISLTVSDGNTRAERLYDAFGFKQFGLEPDAFLYDGHYCAKQHRQLIL
jgi:ribosomal protein S18 acetylase RimI-like enzyme